MQTTWSSPSRARSSAGPSAAKPSSWSGTSSAPPCSMTRRATTMKSSAAPAADRRPSRRSRRRCATCRGCGGLLPLRRQGARHEQAARETWMAYAECFVLMLPLRECAGRCGVCLKTAWTMRLRLIECLKAYSPDFRVGRGGACELDETYFPESFKGNRPRAPSPCRGRRAVAESRSTGAASPASRSAS